MKANQTFSSRLALLAAAIISAIVLVVATNALAQNTFTWDGNGGDNFWTTSGNWSTTGGSVVPGSPQGFMNFDGSNRLNNTNSFASGAAGFQVYFKSTAGAFTLNSSNNNSITYFDFGGTAPNIQNEGTALQTINYPWGHGNINEGDLLNINGNNPGGPITFNGAISGHNNGATAGIRLIKVAAGNGTGTITFNGIISDAASGSTTTVELQQAGNANTTILAGNNTYSGGTIISAGTLQVNTGGTLGNSSGSVQFTAAASLVFNETGSLTINNRIYNNGANPSITQSGTGTTTLGGTTDNSGAGLTINAGTVILNKTSSSTVHALGGATDTINSGGLLQLSGTGGDQIFDGTAIAVSSGGAFDLDGLTETITNVSINGSGISNTGAITNSSSSMATLTLGSGTSGGTASTLAGNASIGENGPITLNGAGALTAASIEYLTNLGPGTLVITNGAGADNLNVHLVAAGGTVVLAKGNTSGGSNPSVHATGQITIMNGSTAQLGGSGGFEIFEGRSSTNLSGGVLDMNGQNQAWGTNSGSASAGNLYLNGTGISGGGALINSSSTASVISNTLWTAGPSWPGVVLGSSSSIGGTGNLTINTVISDNGGGLSLTKVGSGTLTLGGASTYSGNTIINAGTLALSGSGSIASVSSVQVAAGATFDTSAQTTFTLGNSATLVASGTGATVGSTAATIKGGTTVSIGSRPISLTFTPTAFTSDTTHPSLLVSQGALTLNNNSFTVNNNGGTALGAGTYCLIQVTGGTINQNATPSYPVSVTGSGLGVGMAAFIQVSGGNVNLVVAQPFTVTYNGNGNTGGTAPTDPNSPYPTGETVTVLGNTGSLVNTGFTFDGWNTEANGSGTSYSPGNTFAMPANNVTLFAQWIQPVATSPTETRNPGASLVIPISSLYTSPDAAGFAVSLSTTFPENSANGVSVLSDGTSLYYTAPSPDNLATDTISYSIADGQGGTASGTITINVSADLSLTIDTPNNLVTLRFYGVPGYTYQVQKSTDPSFVSPPPTNVGSSTSIGGGGNPQVIVVTDGAPSGTVFYRVQVTSP